MELTTKQIAQNYERFRAIINQEFPTRKNELNRLYDEYDDRVSLLPASGVEHYHNAFPGGYVDHVLRVYDFSISEYNRWKELGLLVDNFDLEELKFAAINHDLGKVGLPGNYQQYQQNPSEWHRINQGKLYVHDKKHPFWLVPDGSLFILQHYGVRMSYQEYLAIRTHDGVYDRANEAYYFNNVIDSKPRTNINQIFHNADFMAARFEFERWAKQNPEKFMFYSEGGIENRPNKKLQTEKLTPEQLQQILETL